MFNKKGDVMFRLVSIIITLATAAAIIMLIRSCVSAGELPVSEEMCRIDVQTLGELSFTPGQAVDIQLWSLTACKTIDDLELPLKGYTRDEDGVTRNIAHLIARTKYQMADSTVQDVFNSKPFSQDKCMIMYSFTPKPAGDFKKSDVITRGEVNDILSNVPYMVTEKKHEKPGVTCNDGKDNDGDGVKDGGPGGDPDCTEKRTLCWLKGGKCGPPDGSMEGHIPYNDPSWACDSGFVCFVPNDKSLTYAEYLYSYGGKTQLTLPDEFKPNELYGIAYISPEKCTWLEALWNTGARPVIGYATPLGTVGAIIASSSLPTAECDSKASHIYVGPYNTIEGQCSVQI